MERDPLKILFLTFTYARRFDDETGRRAGFKIQWGQPRVGSTPTPGTRSLSFLEGPK